MVLSIRDMGEIWFHNRQLYPNWVVAPPEKWVVLANKVARWRTQILAIINDLNPADRFNIIRELLWRHEILLLPMSSELEKVAVDTLSIADGNPELDKQGIRQCLREISLALVTAARYQLDGAKFFRRIEGAERFVGDDPGVLNFLMHERCLWSTWEFDFEKLELLLTEWDTTKSDPMWHLRKAALLREVGRETEAKDLINQAMAEIRQIPTDDRSVYAQSREAWGLCSVIDFENRLSVFNRWNQLASVKCDVSSDKNAVLANLKPTNNKPNIPNFDGDFSTTTQIIMGSGNSSEQTYRALRLTEVAGLAVSAPGSPTVGAEGADLMREVATQLRPSESDFAVRLVLRSITYEEDEDFNSVMSRVSIARLNVDEVQTLVDICIASIDYGTSKGWIERVRVSIETLSRLALRLEPDAALKVFEHGLEFYRNRNDFVASHNWISRPLGRLLKRCWRALDDETRKRRFLDVLGAPLIGLDGFTAQLEEMYPEPGDVLTLTDASPSIERDQEDGQRWRHVLDLLVRALREGGEARERAIVRIYALTLNRVLNEQETTEFADALWSQNHLSEYGLPTGVHGQDWVTMVLPEPRSGAASELFRSKWLSSDTLASRLDKSNFGGTVAVKFGGWPNDPDYLEDTLWNVGIAIVRTRANGCELEITDPEKIRMMSLVSQWLDIPIPSHPNELAKGDINRNVNWVIEALGPILSVVKVDDALGERLYQRSEQLIKTGLPAYAPLGQLAQVLPDRVADLETALRNALWSSDDSVATRAVACLGYWLRMAKQTHLTEAIIPSDEMMKELGSVVAARREQNLREALELITWMFDQIEEKSIANVLDHLLVGLQHLATELSYDSEGDYSDIFSLRLRCARLAASMAKAGYKDLPEVSLWLDIASKDTFPEVRQAVSA